MSFSFRNLFSQDESPDAANPAGAGAGPPGSPSPAAQGQTQPGGAAQPFGSGAFGNPFSGGADSGAPVEPGFESESNDRVFVPNPQPTNRGSFEALFAGQGTVAHQAPGRSASFSVREILPFIPPSLVSQGPLPFDQTIEIPLPAGGGSEVKLSAIQSVCPRIFATEITPLNDSEVMLPHGEAEPVNSGADVSQPEAGHG
ncbi:MAG: hypothetical protein ACC661_10520, partial [Verrucomicrobiales bacterium]